MLEKAQSFISKTYACSEIWVWSLKPKVKFSLVGKSQIFIRKTESFVSKTEILFLKRKLFQSQSKSFISKTDKFLSTDGCVGPGWTRHVNCIPSYVYGISTSCKKSLLLPAVLTVKKILLLKSCSVKLQWIHHQSDC